MAAEDERASVHSEGISMQRQRIDSRKLVDRCRNRRRIGGNAAIEDEGGYIDGVAIPGNKRRVDEDDHVHALRQATGGGRGHQAADENPEDRECGEPHKHPSSSERIHLRDFRTYDTSQRVCVYGKSGPRTIDGRLTTPSGTLPVRVPSRHTVRSDETVPCTPRGPIRRGRGGRKGPPPRRALSVPGTCTRGPRRGAPASP